MTDVFQRLRRYMDRAKEQERDNINSLTTMGYPRKCIRCYEAGIRFCRHWLQDYNCESWERQQHLKVVAEKMEAFL